MAYIESTRLKKRQSEKNKNYFKYLIFALIIIFVYFVFIKEKSVSLGPGVFAPDDPEQINLEERKTIDFKGYKITFLAKFKIKAKVLSKENYSYGREAELSPTDLALGWGRMSDEAIIKEFEFKQSGRWYFWKTASFPISRREIETHSANMHIIPADSLVERVLKRIIKGQIVEIEGYLVSVKADDGWSWESSLSREDTGGHACELIYAEDIVIVKSR